MIDKIEDFILQNCQNPNFESEYVNFLRGLSIAKVEEPILGDEKITEVTNNILLNVDTNTSYITSLYKEFSEVELTEANYPGEMVYSLALDARNITDEEYKEWYNDNALTQYLADYPTRVEFINKMGPSIEELYEKLGEEKFEKICPCITSKSHPLAKYQLEKEMDFGTIKGILQKIKNSIRKALTKNRTDIKVSSVDNSVAGTVADVLKTGTNIAFHAPGAILNKLQKVRKGEEILISQNNQQNGDHSESGDVTDRIIENQRKLGNVPSIAEPGELSITDEERKYGVQNNGEVRTGDREDKGNSDFSYGIPNSSSSYDSYLNAVNNYRNTGVVYTPSQLSTYNSINQYTLDDYEDEDNTKSLVAPVTNRINSFLSHNAVKDYSAEDAMEDTIPTDTPELAEAKDSVDEAKDARVNLNKEIQESFTNEKANQAKELINDNSDKLLDKSNEGLNSKDASYYTEGTAVSKKVAKKYQKRHTKALLHPGKKKYQPYKDIEISVTDVPESGSSKYMLHEKRDSFSDSLRKKSGSLIDAGIGIATAVAMNRVNGSGPSNPYQGPMQYAPPQPMGPMAPMMQTMMQPMQPRPYGFSETEIDMASLIYGDFSSIDFDSAFNLSDKDQEEIQKGFKKVGEADDEAKVKEAEYQAEQAAKPINKIKKGIENIKANSTKGKLKSTQEQLAKTQKDLEDLKGKFNQSQSTTNVNHNQNTVTVTNGSDNGTSNPSSSTGNEGSKSDTSGDNNTQSTTQQATDTKPQTDQKTTTDGGSNDTKTDTSGDKKEPSQWDKFSDNIGGIFNKGLDKVNSTLDKINKDGFKSLSKGTQAKIGAVGLLGAAYFMNRRNRRRAYGYYGGYFSQKDMSMSDETKKTLLSVGGLALILGTAIRQAEKAKQRNAQLAATDGQWAYVPQQAQPQMQQMYQPVAIRSQYQNFSRWNQGLRSTSDVVSTNPDVLKRNKDKDKEQDAKNNKDSKNDGISLGTLALGAAAAYAFGSAIRNQNTRPNVIMPYGHAMMFSESELNMANAIYGDFAEVISEATIVEGKSKSTPKPKKEKTEEEKQRIRDYQNERNRKIKEGTWNYRQPNTKSESKVNTAISNGVANDNTNDNKLTVINNVNSGSSSHALGLAAAGLVAGKILSSPRPVYMPPRPRPYGFSQIDFNLGSEIVKSMAGKKAMKAIDDMDLGKGSKFLAKSVAKDLLGYETAGEKIKSGLKTAVGAVNDTVNNLNQPQALNSNSNNNQNTVQQDSMNTSTRPQN